MIAVLRRAGLRRLWAGEVVSMLGDWLTYVAVGVLAIEQGGGLAVLGVLLAHTLPRVIVAPWAGRVADRFDRRSVLVAGSLARGLAVVGMVVAAWLEAPGWVQAGLVLRMALGAFVDAARGAVVPRLVPAHQLAAAHALLGATWSVVFAGGVVLGGALVAWLGPAAVLGIDAASFGVAAIVFAGLPRLRPLAGGRAGAGGDGPRPSWRRVGAMLRRRPALRRVVLAKAPVMLANGAAFVLAHGIAGTQSGTAVAITLGGLHGLRALGTGVGPLLWVRVAALRGTETGLRVATACVLIGVFVFGISDGGVWPWLGALAWGMGMGSHWATAATLQQRRAPDAVRGRITAIDLVVHTTGHAAGGAIGTMAVAAVAAPSIAVGVTVPIALLVWVILERAGDRWVSRADEA